MLGLALIALAGLAAGGTAAAELRSYAIVRDDASLLVGNRVVRLAGIFIPDGGTQCRSSVRPVRCAGEAALALESRIRGFVRCETTSANPDGSLEAFCYSRGVSAASPEVDLGASLLSAGLALAAPGAPWEYVGLERIARAQNRGLWSDSLRRVR